MDNSVNVFGSITLTLSKESVEAAVASQLGGNSLTALADLVSQLKSAAELQQSTIELQRQRIEALESKVERILDTTDLEDRVDAVESKVEDMDFDDLDSRVDDLERSMREVGDLPSVDDIVTSDSVDETVRDVVSDIFGDFNEQVANELRNDVRSLMSLRQKLIDTLVGEPVVSDAETEERALAISEPETVPVSETVPIL